MVVVRLLLPGINEVPEAFRPRRSGRSAWPRWASGGPLRDRDRLRPAEPPGRAPRARRAARRGGGLSAAGGRDARRSAGMLRLTLVCHGATAANRPAAFPLDEPLEPRALERRARSPERGRPRPRSPARRCGRGRRRRPWGSPPSSSRRFATATTGAGRVTTCRRSRSASRRPWRLSCGIPSARPHGGESIGDLVARVGGVARCGFAAARIDRRGHACGGDPRGPDPCAEAAARRVLAHRRAAAFGGRADLGRPALGVAGRRCPLPLSSISREAR